MLQCSTKGQAGLGHGAAGVDVSRSLHLRSKPCVPPRMSLVASAGIKDCRVPHGSPTCIYTVLCEHAGLGSLQTQMMPHRTLRTPSEDAGLACRGIIHFRSVPLPQWFSLSSVCLTGPHAYMHTPWARLQQVTDLPSPPSPALHLLPSLPLPAEPRMSAPG